MGMFAAAGLNPADFNEDPYNFGDSHWPLHIESVKEPKAGPSGKFGIYVWFEVAHEKYEKLSKFGRWIQLPSPLEVQQETGVAFDPANDLNDAKALRFLIKFMVCLGFGLDEIAADKINPETDWTGKLFMGKIRVTEGDSGFDQLEWFNPKPYVDGSMVDETTPQEGNGEFANSEDEALALAAAALDADANA